MARPTEDPANGLTVAEFLLERWLPSIEMTLRPNTFVSYSSHLTNHVVAHLGQLHIETLDGPAFNAIYAELLRAGRRRGRRSRGLSPTTVRRVHATLHRAFKDAVRWVFLDKNPVDDSDPPRQTRHDVMRTWTVEELRHFLSLARTDELFELWQLSQGGRPAPWSGDIDDIPEALLSAVTGKGLIESAQTSLSQIAETGDRVVDQRIAKATASVARALQARFWNDEALAFQGQIVFEEVAQAVSELSKIGSGVDAAPIVEALVDGTQLLAVEGIAEAEERGVSESTREGSKQARRGRCSTGLR